MCNRAFKTKLIRKITEVMGGMVMLRKSQRLIVDFIGDPIEYSTRPGGMSISGSDHPSFARHLKGFPPIGEADCKFPRWAPLLHGISGFFFSSPPLSHRWVNYISSLHPNTAVDVVVEATDSDYILIAMLHYEVQCRTAEMDGAGLGRVTLRRIQCRGKEHAAGEAAASARKRAKGGGDGDGGEAKKQPAKRAKREMEYIHVPLLCEVMSTLVREMFEGGTPMRCLACIVALGGTDFCRGTPRIGPHRCALPPLLHCTAW